MPSGLKIEEHGTILRIDGSLQSLADWDDSVVLYTESDNEWDERDSSISFVMRPGAIKIINHLKEVFNLTEEDLKNV